MDFKSEHSHAVRGKEPMKTEKPKECYAPSSAEIFGMSVLVSDDDCDRHV